MISARVLSPLLFLFLVSYTLSFFFLARRFFFLLLPSRSKKIVLLSLLSPYWIDASLRIAQFFGLFSSSLSLSFFFQSLRVPHDAIDRQKRLAKRIQREKKGIAQACMLFIITYRIYIYIYQKEWSNIQNISFVLFVIYLFCCSTLFFFSRFLFFLYPGT